MADAVLDHKSPPYAAMMNKPRAYSYIRMSTDAQLKGDSLRRQLELSERYAAEHGLELATDFDLKDLGVSAYTGDNVATGALGRFLDRVTAGEIPVGSYLLVESLDRLSRETPRLALPRFLDIVNAGIILVTLADGRKYTTDDCRLEDLLYSLVVMSRAHEESATKSHRLTAAWKHKRDSVGTKKLTARCPAWLKLSPDKSTFIINEERKTVIQNIFSEAISGMGAYSIARRLNQKKVPAFKGRDGWHTSSINKLLTNRAVIGEFQPHRIINGRRRPEGKPIPYYFPGIIAEQDFYATQDYRSKRRTAGGGRRGDYISNLFSKIALCHYCRGPMRYENKGSGVNRASFLVCDNAVRGKGCRAVRWDYRAFEASFLAFVEELDLGSFLTSSKAAQDRTDIERRIKSHCAQLERLETERRNVYALLEAEGADLPYVRDRLQQCEMGLTALKRELALLEERQRQSQQTRRSYEASKSELRSLISQIGSRTGDDVYRLRAQIASRLRSLLVSLTLSPAGGAPVATWDTAFVAPTGIPAYADVDIGFDPREGRYFIACFQDGTFRAVYPADHDAFAFHQQVVSDKSELEAEEIEGDAGVTNYIDLTPFKPAEFEDPDWPPIR